MQGSTSTQATPASCCRSSSWAASAASACTRTSSARRSPSRRGPARTATSTARARSTGRCSPPTTCCRCRRIRSRSRRLYGCSGTRWEAIACRSWTRPRRRLRRCAAASSGSASWLPPRLQAAMADVLRIIPLGGLGEVGKNMTVYELDDERIVVDAGMSFPRDEHLGVDVILPDFGYLHDRPVRAVVLTHAHEDHVGALPYLMREVRVAEIWATRLTLGLVKSKLDEHGLLRAAELREIEPESGPLDLGPFRVEFVRMAHSVPDAVGLAIETAAGRVFHTGDWKLDHTPVDGLKTDVGRLAELGNRGVDLLLGDST